MHKLHDIYENIIDYAIYYVIVYIDNESPIEVAIKSSNWNRNSIVNALIRSQYSQDSVEALVNNHLLLLSEWQEKLLAGETTEKLIDPEYDRLQEWRSISKQWADELLQKYPNGL